MGSLQKLYERIKNNPKTVRFEEIQKLLRRAGFKERQPRSGSSHYTYTKDGKITTVPYDRPYVKRTYVEQVLALIGDFYEEDDEL